MPPESSDFHPVIGTKEREAYLKRAAKESAFVCVYIMSRKGEAKTFVGTSISPTDIAKQLRRMTWEEVQVDLVAWTEGKGWANRLLKHFQGALDVCHHRDSWYAIEGDRAAEILKAVASGAHIRIFDSTKRQQLFIDELTREMKRRQLSLSPPTLDLTPLGGNLLAFPSRLKN
jgi:hypothetical protein